MKPIIDQVQSKYPLLVCIKYGAIKSLLECPSQYQGHGYKLHFDYSFSYVELPPTYRLLSVILALDPFDFTYLPHENLTRKDITHLNVPAGHAIFFPSACLHSGGANNPALTKI